MATERGIELLAPAGDERALRAALAAGADAVYFGLERWSARAFAGNFAGDTAVAAVEQAHRFGARAHLALNTLLKDDELGPALAALEAPYLAGLDALIVADLGLARLVRERHPDLELHASTQLNTHSSAQCAALARLGFDRAILARELSLDEIAALDPHGLDLECFVHGALCYGYSGDCLLSSMVGGRSGNRGRCSQACRMRYRLSLQKGAASGDLNRVLSTSDLAAIAVLPQLLAAGVTSFKIEGRMKDAAYVGVTTAVYRQALDEARADPERFTVRGEWLESLEQSFSRSFTAAHLEGRHWQVRSGGRGGHRGVLVGRVERVDEWCGEVVVRLARPVGAGDVVYLYTSSGQTEPQRVERAAQDRLVLKVRERVAQKDRLFRLTAEDVGELANDLLAGRTVRRPVPLTMRVSGEEGRPVRLETAVVGGEAPGASWVEVESEAHLVAAQTAPLNEARLRHALGALGGTPYQLAELRVDLAPGLFLPVADVKELRRRAVAALDERRIAARRRTAAEPSRVATPAARTRREGRARARRTSGAASPDLLLRLCPHERPLITAPGAALCLELTIADPLPEVSAAHGALLDSGLPLRCRLPEIVFDHDASWLDEVIALGWDLVYLRGLGALEAARERSPGLAYALEYPLEGLNALAAGVAAGLAGAPPAAVVVSPELSLEELGRLAAELRRFAVEASLERPPALEALAFGRQQVLATRDQLGRAEGLHEAPASGSALELRLEDAKGYVFPASADARGTRLFNARVTNLAPHLEELRAAGVETFAVVQRDLADDERRAFASGGLPALAAFASRERSTTGHLFRGVA